MSYPYGQFTSGESYSTPPTPIDFPQWETVEREQEQQQLQQQQQQQQPTLQQQQQSQEQQPLQHSPTQPTPTFQLIHLEDAQPLETSGQPSGSLEHGTVDHAPIHLHHIHRDLNRSAEGRLEMPGNDLLSMFGIVDHQASSSSASGVTKQTPITGGSGPLGSGGGSQMVMRSARSTRQFHQSLATPYQRPQSTTTPNTSGTGAGSSSSTVAAAAGMNRSTSVSGTIPRDTQGSVSVPLRFVHHNLVPTVPPPSVHSTSSVVQSAMTSTFPSPASASGRMGFGSVTGSPVVQLQQSTLLHASPQVPDNPPSSIQQHHQQHQNPRKRYMIRADTNYDPETGTLTAMLELPGVDKRDVKVSLMTSRHNRVRLLKVYGVLDPMLPVPRIEVVKLFPEACTRERKFGEFMRTFVVPSNLKREDVLAKMKKGVLTLTIQLGPPVEGQDVQEISVD